MTTKQKPIKEMTDQELLKALKQSELDIHDALALGAAKFDTFIQLCNTATLLGNEFIRRGLTIQ